MNTVMQTPKHCIKCHKVRYCFRQSSGNICADCQRRKKLKDCKSMAFGRKNYTLLKKRGY